MLLAGDVGGTKTLLGLFDLPSERAHPRARPTAVSVREFSTSDYKDIIAIIEVFGQDARVRLDAVETACLGVAGPVVGRSAELTNVPWRVDAEAIERTFNIPKVALLNDLQAMAYAVPLLEAHELHTLQPGSVAPEGNAGLIAAGTGLGEALLHNVRGRFIPSPMEAGHADFAARTEREIVLLRNLVERFGRADVERVVSGQGLVNIHRVTHDSTTGPCRVLQDLEHPDAPAAITEAGLEGRCAGCVAALEMFVDAYGAEAGNLALRTISSAGMFVGGGIAPKILPAIDNGRFIRAFVNKHPMDDVLRRMPVHVILNRQAGLLGAAVYATELRVTRAEGS